MVLPRSPTSWSTSTCRPRPAWSATTASPLARRLHRLTIERADRREQLDTWNRLYGYIIEPAPRRRDPGFSRSAFEVQAEMRGTVILTAYLGGRDRRHALVPDVG